MVLCFGILLIIQPLYKKYAKHYNRWRENILKFFKERLTNENLLSHIHLVKSKRVLKIKKKDKKKKKGVATINNNTISYSPNKLSLLIVAC